MNRNGKSGYRPLAFSERNAARLRKSELRIVVTGASGWLGQASLEMIESALGDDLHSRVFAFASQARSLILRSGSEIALAPLDHLPLLDPAPTLLLHYAFLTKDRTFDIEAEEYARRNLSIRKIVGDAMQEIQVTHLLLPSSGAVYGLPTSADRSLCPDPVRNPYGTQKILDEDHFLGICRGLGARVAIPRIFNISGPYINKHDGYALSSMINAALAGGPVTLHATRRVIRAYTSVRDLVDVSVGWLLQERRADVIVFDTGGDEPVEIGQLAQHVLELMDRVGIGFQRPGLSGEPDDIYVGDGRVLRSMADKQGVALSDLRSQIVETMEYLAAVH
jgi:nucleoside-diphosphate-sugar epimerase